ncbi:peptide chain release factor 1 [Haloarcula onubensis]|uniref:Peptide chain release factor 1 n=1 Tax=Haloarcula onubensis TaxID=2950539 RepID=A0ABU2FP33_9EURY|nr:peptide chain release factor 1 [Halomicroarcula sp. S3CR25-11]MDS0282518.1 peptide chain release factor 1 [Halomicroarcula sp. S3CR25-11]
MSTSETRRDLLETVSNVEADEQRLLSVAVPPELSLEAARERIEEAHTDAEQLERDETTEGTRAALETVRRVLNDYDETPANGLAVYAGVVGGDEVVYTFDDLAEPVPEFAFERDSEFDTDPLAVSPDTGRYGLLVVEHGKAALGTTAGEGAETVATLQSDTAADTPTSGELGDREQGQREFFEDVARRAGVAFLDEDPDDDAREDATPGEPDIDPVEGLFVGGSSVTATEFLEQGYLDHRLQQRVLGDAVSVGEASADGLEQLAAKVQDRLEAAERAAIEEHLGDLFAELDAGEAAVVGREDTEEALEYEAVETVLATESVPAERLRPLEQRAVEQGGDLVVVPADADGYDRLEDEGGVGAILRYPIE